MDSLPDAIVQYILSHTSNAKDVASCTCVSKRWKDSIPYLRSLYFPRNLNDKLTGGDTTDNIVKQMVSSMCQLEELVVYCPFTSVGLASWLSLTGPSLRYLELRMDNLVEQQPCTDKPSKLDCIGAARNLESLKLWGVLMIHSPKWLEWLEVQGCSWIRVPETQCLRNLSIANNSGRVYMVDFGKLAALDFLSIRGVQWCWEAISKMLQLANEVDSRFVIHCLEETVITVRSPLNAEQKMNTLESLVKYGRNLKKMTIRILDMKSSHSSADDFFQEICRFRCLNRKIVSIE
ncbi:F-box/RNI-like superfamily protein [Actinidia rufa]|uniref:F-box/RNI-like superfamily protein n=1 Tax=Actinidia rufa TaxID=165716 RepID=A0A7J0EQD4_9ERIC|nr:F-box/RNI-like superfamily protein [Actinidia rufa]